MRHVQFVSTVYGFINHAAIWKNVLSPKHRATFVRVWHTYCAIWTSLKPSEDVLQTNSKALIHLIHARVGSNTSCFEYRCTFGDLMLPQKNNPSPWLPADTVIYYNFHHTREVILWVLHSKESPMYRSKHLRFDSVVLGLHFKHKSLYCERLRLPKNDVTHCLLGVQQP